MELRGQHNPALDVHSTHISVCLAACMHVCHAGTGRVAHPFRCIGDHQCFVEARSWPIAGADHLAVSRDGRCGRGQCSTPRQRRCLVNSSEGVVCVHEGLVGTCHQAVIVLFNSPIPLHVHVSDQRQESAKYGLANTRYQQSEVAGLGLASSSAS
jgi:hypothetical protein